MIQNILQIIEKLVEREKKIIEGFPEVKHPGTIGDMYEGLTQKIIKAIAAQDIATLDIRVVDGFIKGANGLSKQLDCMIVRGEGTQLPNTNHYIYPIKDVIAVIEVKKSLYSAEIKDSYEKFISMTESFTPYIPPFNNDEVYGTLRALTGHSIIEDESQLSEQDTVLFHAIRTMYLLPLKIALGYDGFQSQKKLNKAFVDYLREIGSFKKHYGAVSIPDLIIPGNYALFKHNFMPFQTQIGFPINDAFILLSEKHPDASPLLYLIMMIYSKMQLIYNLPESIWDGISDIVSARPFLSTSLKKIDGLWGWEYVCSPEY